MMYTVIPLKNKEFGGESPKKRTIFVGISRRQALAYTGLALAARPVLRAAPPFWETKPASQWTPEEITKVVTRSPWAKEVNAQYRAAMDDPRIQPGAPLVNRPGEPIPGECGLVPCANVMPGKVVVIWESAQPIQEALHPLEPPDFNGRYIISIRGLAGNYTTGTLKAGTDLVAEDRPPLQPGVVGRRNNTWLFGFSRELLPLSKDDGDVEFTVRIGEHLSSTLLRATFKPKDMVYHGQLAL
jgi:hypothetical protein